MYDLTEEQKEAFNNLTKAYREFAETFLKAAREAFREAFRNVSKLVKEVYESIEKVSKEDKIKYDQIKRIKPKVYLRINKPKLIHCRSNC